MGGWVTIQKIMPLHGLSSKLRLSRSSAELRFQDSPSVATTKVQTDQPPASMPGPSYITTSNLLPAVTSGGGLDRKLPGHGRGHRVMDCSPSSVTGHQHPEWPKTSVSLSVTPVVITDARAASLSLD